jgi:hypothetical protein
MSKEQIDLMKDQADAALNKTKDFLKMAFCVDGEVTTTGKSCMVMEQNGESYEGVPFRLKDSERGEFIIIMANPNKMEEPKSE